MVALFEFAPPDTTMLISTALFVTGLAEIAALRVVKMLIFTVTLLHPQSNPAASRMPMTMP